MLPPSMGVGVRHESEELCYAEDEGRPLGAAIQVEASNHLKLLWSKAMVVSVKEKARLNLVR
jgi:hypothetical protein